MVHNDPMAREDVETNNIKGVAAFVINDRIRLECAMDSMLRSFGHHDAKLDALLGLLYYTHETPLIKKAPLSELTSVYEEMTALDTNVTTLYIGERTSSGFQPENIPPFRFKNWSFSAIVNFSAHSEFDRNTLPVPMFLRTNIRSCTAHELLFHFILSFLHADKLIDLPEPPPRAMYECLSKATSLMPNYAELNPGEKGFEYMGAISNGPTLIAFNYNLPIWFRSINGIEACKLCEHRRKDYRLLSSSSDHPYVKSDLLTSIRPEREQDFHKIPFNSVIIIREDLGYEIFPIETFHKKA